MQPPFGIAPTRAFSFSEGFSSLLFVLLSAAVCLSPQMHRSSHCSQQYYFYSEQSFAAVSSECHLQTDPVIIERVHEIKT